MKFLGCLLPLVAFLAACSSDPNKPPVPEAYEIQQMKRYEYEKRSIESTWR